MTPRDTASPRPDPELVARAGVAPRSCEKRNDTDFRPIQPGARISRWRSARSVELRPGSGDLGPVLMPRVLWPFLRHRPILEVVLSPTSGGRPLVHPLITDTGAGIARAGCELLLHENHCLLCGGIPSHPAIPDGARSGSFPVPVVRDPDPGHGSRPVVDSIAQAIRSWPRSCSNPIVVKALRQHLAPCLTAAQAQLSGKHRSDSSSPVTGCRSRDEPSSVPP
jgi:hypothetical protein